MALSQTRNINQTVETAFLGELERIFKEEFLKAAPLYQASSKLKLPYEDLHRPTLFYRGSLKEVVRTVEEISDYESFQSEPEVEEIIELATKFGQQAGNLVDGLIRLENRRSSKGADPRDVRNTKVIDVFEHSDGRRNAQVFFVQPGMSPNGPGTDIKPWLGYKFVFAAANIVLEYQKQV